MSRWSFLVEQDGMVVASGDAPTEDGAKREAGHYAMMYSQDGPVKVSVKRFRVPLPCRVRVKRRMILFPTGSRRVRRLRELRFIFLSRLLLTPMEWESMMVLETSTSRITAISRVGMFQRFRKRFMTFKRSWRIQRF